MAEHDALLSRREFLRRAAAGAAVLGLGAAAAERAAPQARKGGAGMALELVAHDTRAVISREHGGIERLVAPGGAEVPFLIPALTAEHFFTGVWPRPANALDYEPLSSAGSAVRVSGNAAEWRQQATPYCRVETHLRYEVTGPGTVEATATTRSHAASYPHDYVGVFYATMPVFGGQRGIHLLVPDSDGAVRWHYFEGGGDSWAPRANTVLGPNLPSAPHDRLGFVPYFFAEAALRFALPILVMRWQGLYYSLEADSPSVAFANVLLGTAIGGPSGDIYWRLRPGEVRTLHLRVTVGEWPGWEVIEERYRAWPRCVAHGFRVTPVSHRTRQHFSPPEAPPRKADSGLALSERLFEERGRPLLKRLGLLDRCSVGCFGGSSQNAGLDDAASRDHVWGPYLTFLLRDEEWEKDGPRLKQALQEMPDGVGGVPWMGYQGPFPRRTDAHAVTPFLRALTGLHERPETDRDWLPYLTRQSFLGRRWTERLFDAGQGTVFHDPGKQFTELWRHWTLYVPPDLHRALLARSLFRVWNAGTEYNLGRLARRGDPAAFALGVARFVEEVLELAFGWNEQFVPQAKWRMAQSRCLPICPVAIREGVESLAVCASPDECLRLGRAIATSLRLLMKDLYHLPGEAEQPLSAFAHAMRDSVEDPEVRAFADLEW